MDESKDLGSFYSLMATGFSRIVAYRLSPILFIFLLALSNYPAAADTSLVWVADQDKLQRIDTATNQVTQRISLTHAPRAVAVNPKDGSLWVLTRQQILKFDAAGRPSLALKIAHSAGDVDQCNDADQCNDVDQYKLVLNPYDGSIWISNKKHLLHLDAQGQRLWKGISPSHVRALYLDIDASLWLLGTRRLLHFSPSGAALPGLDLSTIIAQPQYLAVDSLGGYVWVANKHSVIQLDAADLSQRPRPVLALDSHRHAENKDDKEYRDYKENKDKDHENGKTITALAVHPVFGTLWVTSKDRVFILDRTRTSLKTIDLNSYDLGKIEHLAFEPISSSLWLGGRQTIGRFTGSGDFATKVLLDEAIEVLATTPFRLHPTLTLIEPLDNSTTNNPRPLFQLALGANCNDIPCYLAPAYTNAFSLDAMLNHQPISNRFSIENT